MKPCWMKSNDTAFILNIPPSSKPPTFPMCKTKEDALISLQCPHSEPAALCWGSPKMQKKQCNNQDGQGENGNANGTSLPFKMMILKTMFYSLKIRMPYIQPFNIMEIFHCKKTPFWIMHFKHEPHQTYQMKGMVVPLVHMWAWISGASLHRSPALPSKLRA